MNYDYLICGCHIRFEIPWELKTTAESVFIGNALLAKAGFDDTVCGNGATAACDGWRCVVFGCVLFDPGGKAIYLALPHPERPTLLLCCVGKRRSDLLLRQGAEESDYLHKKPVGIDGIGAIFDTV